MGIPDYGFWVGSAQACTLTDSLETTALRGVVPGGRGGSAQFGGGMGGGPLTSIGMLLLLARAVLLCGCKR